MAVVLIAGGRAQAMAGTRCDGSGAAKPLWLSSRDWQVARWRVEDGREVIAAVPLAPLPPVAEMVKPHPRKAARPTPPQPPLVIRLALARDANILWRGEIRPDAKASPDLREVLE